MRLGLQYFLSNLNTFLFFFFFFGGGWGSIETGVALALLELVLETRLPLNSYDLPALNPKCWD